jgi:hypothetical protein
MLLQVWLQLLDWHRIYASRAFVAHYSAVCFEQVLACDHRFHQLFACWTGFFFPYRDVWRTHSSISRLPATTFCEGIGHLSHTICASTICEIRVQSVTHRSGLQLGRQAYYALC